MIDQIIKVETPNGASWYRYNHDGYGEMDDGRPWNFDGKYTGRGRLWALLAGERGEYELARGEKDQARGRLDAMLAFANEGMMLPEQIWDQTLSPSPDLKFGEGTGSATPLAWSMAQFVRLVVNLEEGRNVMLPDIVAARYVKQTPPARAMTAFNAPAAEVLQRMETGKSFSISGRLPPNSRAFVMYGDTRRELTIDPQRNYEFDVPIEKGASHVIVATVASGGATSFERLLVHGLSTEEKQKEERAATPSTLVERIRSATISPMIDGEDAVFIYRGAAQRVEVVGDFTNWSPRSLVLREVPGTNVKYHVRKFPKETRAEYKMIADGEWILDPLNPHKNDNGVGGFNSSFTMPDYRAPSIAEDVGGSNSLKLEVLEVPSRLLQGARRIRVYLPPDYAASGPNERYPVLYLQDGSDYIARGRAAEIANKMISEKRVAPFIIVFIDPVNRMKEYWANDTFADFMAKELVPFVDARLRTRADREHRALLGASLGGVISVWTALRHPQLFARVGGQSSAFQIDDERVVGALTRLDAASRRQHPFKFYFDVGRLEPILEVNRRVQTTLTANGYPVVYREAEAGHNYTTWRDQLAEAYTALWRK